MRRYWYRRHDAFQPFIPECRRDAIYRVLPRTGKGLTGGAMPPTVDYYVAAGLPRRC